MKRSKTISSILIVLLVFILVITSSTLLFAVCERVFPCATLRFKKDLLFIGCEKELEVFDTEGLGSISLEELMKDERTTFNNNLILVSSDHPISDSLDFSSVSEYKDTDVFFDKNAHKDYSDLSAYIQEKYGQKLYVSSAYRDEKEQQELFDELGPETAQKPGESEHQCGLAIDVYVSGYSGASFFKTDIGKYVNTYAHKYGFIIRYPDDKTDITKIDFEPWHIRYVGHPHSDIISLNNITLEEYLDMLSVGEYYSFSDDLIVKIPTSATSVKIPSDYTALSISEDNCGNYILTFTLG